MHFYITGDTHKKFDRVETFCQDQHTTPDDVMIILGDSGINYWLSPKDEKLKERVNRIPITFFCIHGNHEGRPWESPPNSANPNSFFFVKHCVGFVFIVEDVG